MMLFQVGFGQVTLSWVSTLGAAKAPVYELEEVYRGKALQHSLTSQMRSKNSRKAEGRRKRNHGKREMRRKVTKKGRYIYLITAEVITQKET